MTITTIIPVYNLSSDRKRNLEFLYNRLKDQLPSSRIIISVQSSENDGDYYEKFEEVIYFKNKFINFNKSALINYSLDSLEIISDFIMLLDGDVYFKFKNLEDQLNLLSNENVIKPFSECAYLTEQLTLEFIEKRKLVISGGLKKISALGGGALILKSSLIKDKNIRYDENFSGWGWEDIDFGDNIRSKFFIKTIDQPSIHLYHDTNQESSRNYLYYQNKNKCKNKIVHAFNYACIEKNNRLYSAQIKAVESFFVAKKNLDVLILNACSDFCLSDDNIKTVQLFETAKNIGSDRDLPYLNEIVNSALPFVEDDGWIVYTNSDCVISDKLYESILKYNYDYIEFKRQDVDSGGNHIRSIKRGTDGFAIKRKLLEKIPMPKLIIGEPYWDDVISKTYAEKADKFMIINNELIHVDHQATYDINNLTIAGEFNYKQLLLIDPSIEIEKNNLALRDKTISDYVDSQIEKRIASENSPEKKITTKKRKNILALSMCLNKEKKSDLYNRELLCLQSLESANACDLFDNIVIIINDANDQHKFLMQKYLPTAHILKANEQFTSFNELFVGIEDYSNKNENVWLTYINSDCCVKTLSFLNSNPAILYRYEVDCDNPNIINLYSAPKEPNLTGIDGFYCPVSFFKELAKNKKTNFYFGNPAWDVVLGIKIINELKDTVRIRDELYHLRHDAVWKDTLSGSAVYPSNNKFITHNNKLYFEELDKLANTNLNKKVSCINISEDEKISCPKHKARIVIPFHNPSLGKCNPLRTFALKQCLSSILRQGDIDYSEIVIVEAVLKGEKSVVKPIVDEINKYNNIQVATIYSNSKNSELYSHIYQKEVLLNIGAKHNDNLKDDDILIFLDSDILIKDPSWLKAVCDKFSNSDGLLLYPWNETWYLDILFKEMNSVHSPSIVYSDRNSDQTESYCYFNPGMCVSLRKKDFKGMPEWFYLGGGDTAFLYAHGQSSDMSPSFVAMDHYRQELSLIKERKKYVVDNISIDIYHIWHGPIINYSNKFNLTSDFKTSIRDILKKEESGLIRWKTIKCQEFLAIQRYELQQQKQ